jgi:hypothetical protein
LASPFIPDKIQLLFKLPVEMRGKPRLYNYTLRRFGGLQPLCGIGVVSLMDRTSIPAEASARTADSRPDPGPLTRTSTVRTP